MVFLIFTCGADFLIQTVTIILSVRDIYIRHYDYEPNGKKGCLSLCKITQEVQPFLFTLFSLIVLILFRISIFTIIRLFSFQDIIPPAMPPPAHKISDVIMLTLSPFRVR